ncbi:hypothetical protein HEGA106846_01745 [Helicobacter ganmani]
MFVAQLVSAIQQYAKENNMDILKVNWQRANVSWNQSFVSASSSEQKEMLENVLGVLESESAIQKGLYIGETESPAIDILSEILYHRLLYLHTNSLKGL